MNQEESEENNGNTRDIPLSAQISAALFVSAKPLLLSDLSQATGYSEEEVEEVLQNLAGLFQEEVHGVYLSTVQGGFQLRTSPGAISLLRKMIPAKTRKFSRAAAETLAVIAYKQPVQRAEIEAIRGVDALPTLKTLLEAKVIRVIGRDNEIGKPALYATTEKFLERFGLNDLSELPTTREIQELENEPGEEASEEASEDSSQEAGESKTQGASDDELAIEQAAAV